MTASRTIIWTLAQPQVGALPEAIRARMVEEVRAQVKETDDAPLRQAADELGVHSFFAHATNHEHVLPFPGGEIGDEDPFVALLRQIDPDAKAGVDSDFLTAAVAEWKATGEGRAELLEGSDLVDRLAEHGLLLQQHAPGAPQVVPRDFCDDNETGATVGLGGDLATARKVCYGIFGSDFPRSALGATHPGSWSERLPEFWLLSDARSSNTYVDGRYCYEAGLLREKVFLPNLGGSFGPVVLTWERTTANDGTWSFLAYRLAVKDAVTVDQGWYLVRRPADAPHSSVMVKFVEFDGDDAWLDAVCEWGLLQGGRALLGIGQGPGSRGPVPAGGPLTGAVTGYLDQTATRWDTMSRNNIREIQAGLAAFEAKPMRFGWMDNVRGVVANSTQFLAEAGTGWADVVQQKLPDALDRADAVDPDRAKRATTPAHLVAAGWRTMLGVYQAGVDLTRAAGQVLGPGQGRDDEQPPRRT